MLDSIKTGNNGEEKIGERRETIEKADFVIGCNVDGEDDRTCTSTFQIDCFKWRAPHRLRSAPALRNLDHAAIEL
jgi:hypothetical protein